MKRIAIIYCILFIIGASINCDAGDFPYPVCEMVSPNQLAEIYPSTLFPSAQENGCRWSDRPNGKAIFQIGIIKSANGIRQFFEKELPHNYQLKKITDLGDRGLYTESKDALSVIAIRKGDWVLVSTVDLLYIQSDSKRQKQLWGIYRELLKNLD